jgi:hypothetical protein
MPIPSYRASEALYVVIIREKNAEQLLKAWAKAAKAQVVIENNRMKIFEHRSLNMFQLNWPHDWDNVTIWDAWNRRHLYLD